MLGGVSSATPIKFSSKYSASASKENSMMKSNILKTVNVDNVEASAFDGEASGVTTTHKVGIPQAGAEINIKDM
mgnify:CR=1 FL=1